MNSALPRGAVLAAASVGVVRVVRRRVDGVRRVRRSVGEFRDHWAGLASGHDPQGSTFRFVALGDSAAQGVGATSPDRGYVSRIAAAVAERTGRDVATWNLSVSGAKAADVVARQLPALAGLGFLPDLLTLDIGGNDVMDSSVGVADFLDAMGDVLAALPPGSFVADVPRFLIPPWTRRSELFTAGLRPLVLAAGHHTVDLQSAARAHGRARTLLMLAEDAFHPNDRGYEGWARVFLQAIEPQLGTGR